MVLLGLIGIDPGLSLTALFWGNVVVAAAARYAIGYVVGSLIGVAYDSLDYPSPLILTGMVFAVGFIDGILAWVDTRSVFVGGAYVLAWLCYVPIFTWLFDEDAGDDRSGPLRLS